MSTPAEKHVPSKLRLQVTSRVLVKTFFSMCEVEIGQYYILRTYQVCTQASK